MEELRKLEVNVTPPDKQMRSSCSKTTAPTRTKKDDAKQDAHGEETSASFLALW